MKTKGGNFYCEEQNRTFSIHKITKDSVLSSPLNHLVRYCPFCGQIKCIETDRKYQSISIEVE